MRRYLLIFIFVFITVFGIFGIAYAHPGKLDKSGGHVCKSSCAKYGPKNGQYHKHKSKKHKKAKRISKKITKKANKKTSAKRNFCNSNYSGVCVPVASDVDCVGGGGNGPAYVRGPFRVTGVDVYGLDSDKDGLGCELN